MSQDVRNRRLALALGGAAVLLYLGYLLYRYFENGA